MDLDLPGEYRGVDTADALGDVEATAAQWREALELGTKPLDLDGIDTVLISGMGGSGIAGDVLWALSQQALARPVLVHKGFGLPAFVDRRTLVVSFSHSGSTEETLSSFAEAGRRGAARFAVTSGGPLADEATDAGVDLAVIPAGGRPPRHSLGVLLVPALAALGLDEGLDEAIGVISDITAECGREVPTERNTAKQLGQRLNGRVALAWGGHGIGSVAAYRLKCQLNENAKVPALHAELPEAGHNDVVGWEQVSALSGAAVLLSLRDPAGEHPRVARRFDVVDELLAEQVDWRARIDARGTSALARMASLLITADLISVYAALAADCDPSPIRSIDRLKSQLGTPTTAA